MATSIFDKSRKAVAYVEIDPNLDFTTVGITKVDISHRILSA